METIKLTKPYIVEGILFREGVELEIHGEDVTTNEPSDKPSNEIDLGITPKNIKKAEDEETPTLEEDDEETVTEEGKVTEDEEENK